MAFLYSFYSIIIVNVFVHSVTCSSATISDAGADNIKQNKNINETKEETQLQNLPGEINPCDLPPKRGICNGNSTRYYYDDVQKNCLPFQYSGCDLNENNFESLSKCEETCVKKRESRKAAKSSKSKLLKQLDRSVPSGNGSMEKYFGRKKFPITFCNLQKDNGVICPGIKRGNYLNQFYYDEDQNRCVQFVYNGCGGNANRFSSIWECTQSCRKRRS